MHAEALDPRDPVFASDLARCVGLISEAAPAANRAGSGVSINLSVHGSEERK